MKTLSKSILTSIIIILVFNAGMTQFVSGFNYQAVVRNSDGTIMKNTPVSLRATISNDDGNIFEKTYNVSTNEFGLLNVVIGKESLDFNNIDWSKGECYLHIEIDTGSGFTDMGTSTIYPVPMANLAKDVINNDDADADSGNELQTLSISGNQLTISSGNTVSLPPSSGDQWGSQVVQSDNSISGDGTSTNPLSVNPGSSIYDGWDKNVSDDFSGNFGDLSNIPSGLSDGDDDTHLTEAQVDNYVSNNGYLTSEVDGSTTNELQTLSISGTQLTISSGNTISLPPSSGDQWGSQVVQSDNTLSGDGTTANPLSVNDNIITFERSGNLIRQKGNYDTDDFIFGREALPQNGILTSDKMLFFDKSKAAFRAGELYHSLNWAPDNIGKSSFAIGYNTTASGEFSTAMGSYTTASGNISTALGSHTTASGYTSTAIGSYTTASGYTSTAMGFFTTAPSAYETAIGLYNTEYSPTSLNNWSDNDRLFVIGNGNSSSSRSNALTLLKKGFWGLNTDNPKAELDIQDSKDSDEDVCLNLRSNGYNNDAIIKFYEHTNSPVMSLHYDGGDNALYIYDLSTHPYTKRLKIGRTTGSIIPGQHKKADLGTANLAFDDIYYDDLHNQGASAFLDRSPAKEIISYPPRGKSKQDFDYKTERGDVELDPKSLPPGLSDENSLLTDEMVSYNYKTNYEQQIIIEKQKQIILEQDKKIRDLQKQNAEILKRLEALEKK